MENQKLRLAFNNVVQAVRKAEFKAVEHEQLSNDLKMIYSSLFGDSAQSSSSSQTEVIN